MASLMVAFRDSTEVPTPVDMVWDIVADIDNEPRCYPGLTVRSISRTGNVIEREVTVGFRDSRGRRTVVMLHPKESVEVTITEGLMGGTKVITLLGDGSKTKIDIAWDVELVGIPALFRGKVKNQIIKGTKEALDRIVRAIQ